MNIRAHHLLCIRYFQGKGYSKEFVDNFYKVIKELKDNPAIKVINYPDAICGSCLHNINGKCIKKADSKKKVREKDNLIIKYLGLELNQKIKALDANNLVNSKLEKLKEICKECEWKQYCNIRLI